MLRIRAPEVKQMMEEDPDAIVINLLGSDDFRRLRIPDTYNIPAGRDDFVEAVDALAGYRDRRLILHGSHHGTETPPRAARRLEAAGFTDVVEFDGGISEWKAAGYELEHSQTMAMS